jgi:hypothetical protein
VPPETNRGAWQHVILGSGDGRRRFQSVVAVRGGGLRGAVRWRQDLEATGDSEVWGRGGLGG